MWDAQDLSSSVTDSEEIPLQRKGTVMKATLTRIHSPGMGEGVQQSEVLNVGEIRVELLSLPSRLPSVPSPLLFPPWAELSLLSIYRPLSW